MHPRRMLCAYRHAKACALAGLTVAALLTGLAQAGVTGKNAIVWQNNATGETDLWLMNGSAIGSSTNLGTVAPPWGLQGVADFTGTGSSDLLWRNSSTGQVSIWLLNGTSIVSTGIPGTVDSTWSIQGVGDFNKDGKADILWQNSVTGEVDIWLMNGAAIASTGIAANTVDPSWTVQGVGDFNGDGFADILWRNNVTGQLSIWLMNGTSIASTGVPGSIGPQYSIQGVGDFNGDGKADILWQNATTGEVDIWLMNGTAINSTGVAGVVNLPYTIQGVGQYGTGPDAGIAWQNTTTGEVDIWQMSGTSIGSSGVAAIVGNPWQIAPLAPYDCSNTVLCNILSATNNVRANGSFGPGNPAPSATPGGPLLPLTWSVAAATVAQNWASQCNGSMHNANRGPFGENIYYLASTTTPVTITGTDAVTGEDGWATEAANYTYSTNTCAAGDSCSHYTQTVWRSTTAMGCAVAQCTVNSPFGAEFPDYALVVCDYSPPGNFNGESPY